MRSGSDRCRSATRPGASPKPSRTARPDFCSPSRQPNRFSAASAAPSRLSRQRTASTRCARARWRDPSAGTFLRPATARFIGKLCRHKRARSLRRFRHHYRLLVKNDTRERIELADPGRAIEHGLGVGITAIPALHDAGWAEIDVLGVVLAIELRRQQPHDMHPRRAAVAGQFTYRLAVAFGLRQSGGELADDMAQTMRLLLARDMAGDPAGILHILVAVENFRHRGRLCA